MSSSGPRPPCPRWRKKPTSSAASTAIAAIDAAADKLLQAVNNRSYNDAMLDELARTIKENTARLNQE